MSNTSEFLFDFIWSFDLFGKLFLFFTNFIPELTEFFFPFSSLSLFGICCYSVTKSCLTVWNPKDCSMAGFPILHHLLEFAQIHVHWVSDAIQPSHPLSSPSPAFNISQLHGLFQWIGSSHHVPEVGASASASVLLMNIQDWFPLGLTGWISLQSKGLSRVFSSTTSKTKPYRFWDWVLHLSL